MKKMIALVLASLMALSLFACGGNGDAKSGEKTYNSLAELNEAFNCKMAVLEGATHTDEKFRSVKMGDYDVAEYTYTENNIQYTFRYANAPSSFDVTGYIYKDAPAFTEADYGVAFLHPEKEIRLSRWEAPVGQYGLEARGDGEMSDFGDLVYALTDITDVREIEWDVPTDPDPYEYSLTEEEDKVILVCTPIDDETLPVTRATYFFENDKPVRCLSEHIYKTEEEAKDSFEEWKEIYEDYSIACDGCVISIEFPIEPFAELSKAELVKMLKESNGIED